MIWFDSVAPFYLSRRSGAKGDERRKNNAAVIDRRYSLTKTRTRQSASLHCKESFRPYRSRGMRIEGAILAISTMLLSASVFGEGQNTNSARDELNPPRFEVAAQTGYLLGVFGNPD